VTIPAREHHEGHEGGAPLHPPTHVEQHGEADFEVPPPAQITKPRAVAFLALALSVLGVAFLARWLPSRHARQALETETHGQETATPRVQVVAPTVVSSDRAITLPGSVQPLEETVVYPRASGYVKRWLVDLGDHVKEGDLLAEIDTPDLDQQIAQARALLAQADATLLSARANARFSKDNLARYQKLVPQGLASQQDLDKAVAQADVDQASIGVAEATIGSQRANLQYLGQLKTFAKVLAPFAGTITLRNIERGALVTAGTNSPLFRLTATDPVRVYVQIPQDVAPSVRSELAANVTIREYPGRTFAGVIARSAGSLDATTRTMTTEVRVPNPKGELLTGMYAHVSLTLPTPHRVLAIPSTALLTDAGGVRVAVVGPGDHIHLVTVVVERDTGPTVEISTGIVPEDRIVKLPSADLVEGRAVEVAH
jgi:RND family efflux transporter MFP subunit